MNRSKLNRIARLCGGLLVAVGVVAPAHATDYIWCVLQDVKDGQTVATYSSVFAGDWQETQTYESAFWSFVDSRVGLGVSPSAVCSYEDEYSAARMARDDFAASHGHDRDVWTDWTY
jgi:hypothetical protein